MVKKLSIMAMVYALFVVFSLSFLPPSSSSSSSSSSFVSFSLTHRDAEGSLVRSQEADPSDLPKGMPMREFVAAGRAMRGRIERQKRKRNGGGPVVGRFSYLNEEVGDFYLTLAVGNPSQNLIFILDTGSELTWSECSPCKICSGSGGPPFALNKSSSYEKVPCTSPLCTKSLGFSNGCSNSTDSSCLFQVRYGDGSFDAGYLSIDSFHFSQHFVKPFVFGCSVTNIETVPVPSSGIMGLNHGPFSFTSQLLNGHPNMPNKFAYCLPDRSENLNSSGIIKFGDYKLSSKLTYTPLMPPYEPLGALYYYVGLEGISVGESLIKVPNSAAMKSSNKAGTGTIFDSGTAVTLLVESVYRALVGTLEKQTAHLHPFASKEASSDLCYKIPLTASELPRVPTMIFHFVHMADLELASESILYPALVDGSNILACLAFGSSGSISSTLNIIGNYQQQNYWIEYNLQASTLGFAKANCATRS